MEKKRVYEKPALRRVRLDVKTAVLATCNLSTTTDPDGICVVVKGTCFNND
jgi:hypothetical protein